MTWKKVFLLQWPGSTRTPRRFISRTASLPKSVRPSHTGGSRRSQDVVAAGPGELQHPQSQSVGLVQQSQVALDGLAALKAHQHRGAARLVGAHDVLRAPRQQERFGVGVDDRADAPHLLPRRFREAGVLVQGPLPVLDVRKDAGVHGRQGHLAGQAGKVHGEQVLLVAVVVVPDEHGRGAVEVLRRRGVAHRRGASPRRAALHEGEGVAAEDGCRRLGAEPAGRPHGGDPRGHVVALCEVRPVGAEHDPVRSGRLDQRLQRRGAWVQRSQVGVHVRILGDEGAGFRRVLGREGARARGAPARC